MESINSIRARRNKRSKEFRTLVDELKDSNKRVSKQNDRLRNKLGVESQSNEDIAEKTRKLCNRILENRDVTYF